VNDERLKNLDAELEKLNEKYQATRQQLFERYGVEPTAFYDWFWKNWQREKK
jgi:hypothetical protein